jgi:hypothetical protein
MDDRAGSGTGLPRASAGYISGIIWEGEDAVVGVDKIIYLAII